MNNYLVMSTEFEKQKNRQASMLTLGIAGAVLLLFILVKWPIPTLPQPVADNYIDISMGDEMGSGNDQPHLPGDPAPAQQASYTPPQPTPSTAEESRAVETDDRAPADAPVIRNPVVSKPTATKIDVDNKVVRSTPTTQPVVQAPPRPKAVLGRTVGGNGNGGNGADTYSPGTTGGTGGNGTGSGGSGGGSGTGNGPQRISARVVNMGNQTFEDDFKEGGTVVLEVVVDGNGILKSAAYSANGSSLSRSSRQTAIAMEKARQYRFPKIEGGFKQAMSFQFKVQ
ncbi:MAG: hypothetical protein JWP88_240 [Flaviaesturariibacter sp.]|nr:hypothetical protein [Flaviaesturariibacter sp.]